MPDVYIDKLDNMWIDDTVNERTWNKFWNELRRDWEKTFTPVRLLGCDILITRINIYISGDRSAFN